jgi:hypothetical protein
MTAFADAVDTLFTDANMALTAFWRRGGDGEAVPVRLVRRAPDLVADFGPGRVVIDATWLDVRVSEVESLAPGDTFEIDGELLEVRGEPRRDTERLIWTAEARVL